MTKRISPPSTADTPKGGGGGGKGVRPLVDVEIFGDNSTSDIGRLIIPIVDVDPSDIDGLLANDLEAFGDWPDLPNSHLVDDFQLLFACRANKVGLELLARNVVPVFLPGDGSISSVSDT